jgi:hypothetical protein
MGDSDDPELVRRLPDLLQNCMHCLDGHAALEEEVALHLEELVWLVCVGRSSILLNYFSGMVDVSMIV